MSCQPKSRRVEIIKVLYRGAQILILDEPTAVLTPQETEKLFARACATCVRMENPSSSSPTSCNEVLEHFRPSGHPAQGRIRRHGGNRQAQARRQLTEMMVGKKVELNIERPEPVNPHLRLSVHNLSVTNAEGVRVLDNISFEAFSGEILGIAGISGNGQKELLEAIAGLQQTDPHSSVVYYPDDDRDSTAEQLIGKSPKDIRDMGVHLSFVPEDRLGMGLVGSMGMIDNMMLKSYGQGHSPIADRRAPRHLAEEIKDSLGVVTPSVTTPVSRLSGGNVQKVLVGREIAASPSVLMTAYAVRGLDINTSYTIYHLLNEQKKKGVAIIYVGEDLDVLIDLCDRVLVLCGGKNNGIVEGRKTNKEEIGLMMTKLREPQEKGGVA